MTEETDQLLQDYAHLAIDEVSDLLRRKHGLRLSTYEIGRKSRQLGICRRRSKPLTDEELLQVACTLKEIIANVPVTAGYRVIWQQLKQKYHVYISRNTVMQLLRVLTPENVSRRSLFSLKRREYRVPGADFVWHIDGYDKAKKYGMAIHGCIDGYSRMLLWLEVGPTNNNSQVVGGYFMKAVTKYGGLPKLVRGDLGTENVVIEKIQRVMRSQLHDDTLKDAAFLYGKSCMNQRIERFWGSLSTMGLRHSLDHFSDLEGTGKFSTANPLHIEAIRYCYMDIVRKCLEDFMEHWNHHYIRKSKDHSVHGKPELLYYLAQENHLQKVDDVYLNMAAGLVSQVPDVDSDFKEAADLLFDDTDDLSQGPLDRANEKFSKLVAATNKFTNA